VRAWVEGQLGDRATHLEDQGGRLRSRGRTKWLETTSAWRTTMTVNLDRALVVGVDFGPCRGGRWWSGRPMAANWIRAVHAYRHGVVDDRLPRAGESCRRNRRCRCPTDYRAMCCAASAPASRQPTGRACSGPVRTRAAPVWMGTRPGRPQGVIERHRGPDQKVILQAWLAGRAHLVATSHRRDLIMPSPRCVET
jgi:hypothetical protein